MAKGAERKDLIVIIVLILLAIFGIVSYRIDYKITFYLLMLIAYILIGIDVYITLIRK